MRFKKEVIQMAVKDNKAIVRAYFEALDTGNTDSLDELFLNDCRIYRPEQPGPLIGVEPVRRIISMARQGCSEFSTTINDMLQEGEKVAVYITHKAVFRNKCPSRIGTFDGAGKTAKWDAMTIIELRDGKIAEEHVIRDELGMLLSIGALQSAPPIPDRNNSQNVD